MQAVETAMGKLEELTDDEHALRRLYEQGLSYTSIGHQTQRCAPWVSYRIQALVIAKIMRLRTEHNLCEAFRPASLHRIESALQEGACATDIGRLFKLGPIAVHVVRGLHLAGRYRQLKTVRTITAADRDRIKKLIQQGHEFRGIAETVGTSSNTIRLVVRDLRATGDLAPARNRPQRPPALAFGDGPKIVRRLLRSGLRQAEIARRTGLSRQRVSQIVQDLTRKQLLATGS